MIQAELKGKLPEVENSEDVLTSNIFGLLKYVSKDVFLEILSHAKTLSEKKFLDCVEHKLVNYNFEFTFWENIDGFGEPDLIVKFKDETGHELVLCIEVKYYSSKSGEEDNDQLRRYFEGLTLPKSKSDFLGVIYLTKYPSRKELEDSLKCIEQQGLIGAEDKLFQLRWFEITKAIEDYNKESLSKHERLILDDLLLYLKKKNFVEFTEFSFQTKEFNDFSDTFYESHFQKFDGFTFQNSDFDYNLNKNIIYGGI